MLAWDALHRECGSSRRRLAAPPRCAAARSDHIESRQTAKQHCSCCAAMGATAARGSRHLFCALAFGHRQLLRQRIASEVSDVSGKPYRCLRARTRTPHAHGEVTGAAGGPSRCPTAPSPAVRLARGCACAGAVPVPGLASGLTTGECAIGQRGALESSTCAALVFAAKAARRSRPSVSCRDLTSSCSSTCDNETRSRTRMRRRQFANRRARFAIRCAPHQFGFRIVWLHLQHLMQPLRSLPAQSVSVLTCSRASEFLSVSASCLRSSSLCSRRNRPRCCLRTTCAKPNRTVLGGLCGAPIRTQRCISLTYLPCSPSAVWGTVGTQCSLGYCGYPVQFGVRCVPAPSRARRGTRRLARASGTAQSARASHWAAAAPDRRLERSALALALARRCAPKRSQ